MTRQDHAQNVALFRATLDRAMVRQRAKLEAVFRQVLFLLFEAIVVGNPSYGNGTGTPVKTGFARNSWSIADAIVPTEGTPDPAGAGAMQETLKLLTWPLGTTVYYVAGADYTVMLEYGWSMQAPFGMVRIAARDAQAILDDVLAGLDNSTADVLGPTV